MAEFWAKYKWAIIIGIIILILIIVLYFYFKNRKPTAEQILGEGPTTMNPAEFKQGQQLVSQRTLPYYEWSGRASVGPSLGTINAGQIVQFQATTVGSFIAVVNPAGGNPAYVYIDYSDNALKGAKT